MISEGEDSMDEVSFFAKENVAQVLYINLARSEVRKADMENMGAALAITPLHRVEGADAQLYTPDERAEILSRQKSIRYLKDGEWVFSYNFDTGYSDMLLPVGVDIPENISNHAMGRYACQVSQLRAIEKAIRNLEEQGENNNNRWTIIFEDDALLDKADRETINEALKNAPDEAGAVLLAGWQRGGALLGETRHPNLAIPTGTQGSTAIAYRSEMLKIMAEVYRRNLAMTREEGGISSNDSVNVVIQDFQAGISSIHTHSENHILLEVFKEASAGKTATQFFVLNPSLVRETKQSSTIGTSPAADYYDYQLRKPTFPLETVRQVRQIYESNKDPEIRKEFDRMLNPSFLSRIRADDLRSFMKRLQSGKETSGAIFHSKRDQNTEPTIGLER